MPGGAVERQRIASVGEGKRLQQAHQAVDVIAMQMRDADRPQPPETEGGAAPLKLSPLAAVEQKEVPVVLHGNRGGLALKRRQRSPTAKDYSPKHDPRMVTQAPRSGSLTRRNRRKWASRCW